MISRARFEFIAGSPALSFVDTVGDRKGRKTERLADPQSLFDWLSEANLSSGSVFPVTDQDLSNALILREAIYRCGLCAVLNRPFAGGDIDLLNRAAARPPLRPQLQDGKLVFTSEHPVEAALSVLAADALNLMTAPFIGRLRECPGCAMIFVDSSRPGKRRWCSSATGCGNREKVRNLRARRAQKEQKG